MDAVWEHVLPHDDECSLRVAVVFAVVQFRHSVGGQVLVVSGEGEVLPRWLDALFWFMHAHPHG